VVNREMSTTRGLLYRVVGDRDSNLRGLHYRWPRLNSVPQKATITSWPGEESLP
jgi:hypothetical protein